VPGKRTALTVIFIAYLMIVIDISITLTALPQIRDELGMTEAGLSWVQNAYLLAYGGFLLLGARAGDLYGRQRMFVLGIASFTVASLAVGCAPNASCLLAARAAQGLAAAALSPSALALLYTTIADPSERARALGTYSTMSGTGAVLGLVIGGAFTTWLSWRGGFLVNVPTGIALLAATRKWTTEPTRSARQLDLAGAIAATLGMTSVIYGLLRIGDTGWRDRIAASSLLAGIAFLICFVLVQSHAADPLLPLRLFASVRRVGAYATRLLFVGGISGFLFFMSLALQRVGGFTAFETGVAFVPMMVANVGGAFVARTLSKRYRPGQLLFASICVALVGMLSLGFLSADVSFVLGTEIPMVFVGLGGGASIAPMTTVGLAGVAPTDAGAGSGLVNATHQVGAALGLALLMLVSGVDAGHALAYRVHVAFVGAGVLVLLALCVTLCCVLRGESQEST
jgi:MFS family permease